MKDKLKKYLLPNLPYLFFVYLFDKLCQTVRLAPGLDASEKLLHIGQGFQTAFSSSAPSFHALDICVGILGAVFVRLAVYVKGKNAKKYRKGIEYGSARWGTAADIAPYIDPVPDWNIPLTRTEGLTMTSRPKQPKYARNKNILVIGGSGSGKTRFFVKPSIMQMHSSYVITDPKGQLLKETGKMLLHGAPKLDENGKPVRDRHGRIIYEPYRIKVLNTINFSKSMKYNPLAYVRSEKDILKLVNVIIANTKGDGEKSSEDFWVKAERLLYCALIGYIWYEAEPEERNFITLLDLLNACEAREDDETYKSPVDILFDELAQAGAPELVAAAAQIADGTVTWHEQDPAQVTIAEKVKKDEMRLDPADTCEANALRVQASTDAAPARCQVAGRGMRVVRAAVVDANAPQVAAGAVALGHGRVLLGCANGALELLRVKPDGKREMDASAWVQGLHGGNGATWERA